MAICGKREIEDFFPFLFSLVFLSLYLQEASFSLFLSENVKISASPSTSSSSSSQLISKEKERKEVELLQRKKEMGVERRREKERERERASAFPWDDERREGGGKSPFYLLPPRKWRKRMLTS